MTLTVDDRELIEEVATAIDPVWMTPPQGPHLCDNYPGQSDKYREKARQAARAVLQTPRLQSLLSRVEELDAECERAWSAYRIAHNQAMSNGQALLEARAALIQTEVP